MKIPARPAPSVPTGGPPDRNNGNNRFANRTEKKTQVVLPKKKPPPRPPPPKFKDDDKVHKESFPSSHMQDLALIDFSSPVPEPLKITNTVNKKSNAASQSFVSYIEKAKEPIRMTNSTETGKRSMTVGPTVIRPSNPKPKLNAQMIKCVELSTAITVQHNHSPPMPTFSPPTLPNCLDVSVATPPYGIALYTYQSTHKEDLPLQVNDVVFLVHQINDDWLYGRVADGEGLFPSSFIEICVPLEETTDNVATALYEFQPQVMGDLILTPGQKVTILRRVSPDWLYGESNGLCGQFPASFINRVPRFI